MKTLLQQGLPRESERAHHHLGIEEKLKWTHVVWPHSQQQPQIGGSIGADASGNKLAISHSIDLKIPVVPKKVLSLSAKLRDLC